MREAPPRLCARCRCSLTGLRLICGGGVGIYVSTGVIVPRRMCVPGSRMTARGCCILCR
nr:MAG TPA: hypothetical protein [Caudoviricetes sp.]